MSNVFLKKPVSRILGYVIIAMQGILIALLAFDMLNASYMDSWKKYGQDKPSATVYLQSLSEEQNQEINSCFTDAAMDGGAFFIKQETLQGEGGSYAGIKIGVFGDYLSNDVSFSYYGVEVLSKDMIGSLLMSEEKESTLGIDEGSAYMLQNIPTIKFGHRVVIKKLAALTEENQTMAGKYTILSSDQETLEKIINRCAEICNVSPEQITTAKSGSEIDGSFKTLALFAFVVAFFLIQTSFYIILTLRGIDKLGKMLMLGWSRSSFALGLFSDYVWCAVLTVPAIAAICSLFSSSVLRPILLKSFLAYGFLNLLLTLLSIGVSLLIIYSISSIGAIKKRYPTKALYIIGAAGYLAVSIGVVGLCLQIDKPIAEIKENRRIMKSWEEVSDYLVLSSIETGDDANTFSGESKKLDQDLFEYYNSIHEDEDVFLIHTSYFGEDVISSWRDNNVFEHVPTEALWMFIYSGNYVRLQDIDVDPEVFAKAEQGIRVYLIPETWPEEKKTATKEWLVDYSQSGITEGDIDTTFNRERQFEFVDYMPEKAFFTWAKTPTEEKYCQDPVILICTPENMTFFISESLKATGMNSYLKMSPNAAEKGYLNEEYMAKYHLVDNQLSFLRVEKYMDGIKEDLQSSIKLVVAAFAILSVIVIGLMLCLASIFSLANRNRLNVKKFLGYDFFRMYGSPLSSLFLVSVLEVLFLLIKGARYGVLMILVLIVLEFIIFKKFMTGQELSHVISDFKEE